MKKTVNARKLQALKLSRETLRDLDRHDLRAAVGADLVPSVRFCTLDPDCTVPVPETGA